MIEVIATLVVLLLAAYFMDLLPGSVADPITGVFSALWPSSGPVSTGATAVPSPAPGPAPGPSPAPAAPTGPTYIGCYADEGGGLAAGQRGFPVNAGRMSLAQCNAKAKASGAPYFGMQFWPGSGGAISDNAECWYGTGDAVSVLAQAEKWGKVSKPTPGVAWTTQCDQYGGNYYGHGDSNAIYKTY